MDTRVVVAISLVLLVAGCLGSPAGDSTATPTVSDPADPPGTVSPSSTPLESVSTTATPRPVTSADPDPQPTPTPTSSSVRTATPSPTPEVGLTPVGTLPTNVSVIRGRAVSAMKRPDTYAIDVVERRPKDPTRIRIERTVEINRSADRRYANVTRISNTTQNSRKVSNKAIYVTGNGTFHSPVTFLNDIPLTPVATMWTVQREVTYNGTRHDPLVRHRVLLNRSSLDPAGRVRLEGNEMYRLRIDAGPKRLERIFDHLKYYLNASEYAVSNVSATFYLSSETYRPRVVKIRYRESLDYVDPSLVIVHEVAYRYRYNASVDTTLPPSVPDDPPPWPPY